MSTPLLHESTGIREEQLESLLQRRFGNRLRYLCVLITPGGIILRGRTNTYHTKQLAQHAVMEVADVPILANDIEVS